MDKVSLSTPLKTVGDVQDVKEKILDKIPDNILFSKSEEELCFYILSQFDFPKGTIELSDFSSIEAACKVILNLMGIDDDFEMKLDLLNDRKFRSPIMRFLYYFLGIKELPGDCKEQLEVKVNMDLDTINSLITDYEKIDFIAKKEIPRNHNQRTQKVFYDRCIEERVKIEEHLRSGVNDRALTKAYGDLNIGFVYAFFEEYRDRPYKLPMPKSKEYFDINSIDKVGHRLRNITLSQSTLLRDLYKKEKSEFYEKMEEFISDDEVIDSIKAHLQFLPFISEQRKIIFNELAELYKTKKMFGFCALALTQIEGLFTEMCHMCVPNYNNPSASLPDKVNTVRPFHPNSETQFDYFQYHLPNLRNRLLHLGLAGSEKIEILSKEILFDLERVVSIFADLNIDANWFLRLIRKRDDADFMSINTLWFYCKMINSLKEKKQFHYFEKEIESLNRTYIPDVVYNVVFDLDAKLNGIIESIYEPMKAQSALNGFEVDLKSISMKEIATNRKLIKDALDSFFNWQEKSEITELLSAQKFMKAYSKYLDLEYLTDEVQNGIKALDVKYSDVLNKICLISLYVGFVLE